MRDLKFRVYDKTGKCYSDKAFSIDQLGICYVQDEDGYWEEIDEERYIVEQYTGLKDENGKEIYEGDIVTLNGEWEEIEDMDCSVITFDNGCFRVGDACENEAGSYLSDWRVIGNVHENADLMEKK